MKLEEELAKVNKVKAELLKVAEPHSSENLDVSDQKSIADNLNLLNQQQIVIQQAIDKVKIAEEEGEKKGLENAQKLIKKQESQSLEQSEADVKNLEAKFQSTSGKVNSIIDNFQKVHSDLQTLKDQYAVQTQSEPSVPSNSTAVSISEFPESQEEIQLSYKLQEVEKSNLALKMQSKQRELKQIVNSLD